MTEMNPIVRIKAEGLYLDPNITSRKIIELSGLHSSRLYRMCHRRHGMTIRNYIHFLRIKDTIRKVECGEKLHTVWMDCGYNSYSAFSKQFKLIKGTSPRNYFNKKS